MTSGLRTITHTRGFCTMMHKHESHPFQVLNENQWVDYWCFGEPGDESLYGTPVVLLVDDACWCQDADQLNTRMQAAIGHVLDRVREIIGDNQEDDTWMDRWGTENSREIVPVDDLLNALDKLQEDEAEIEEGVEDDD